MSASARLSLGRDFCAGLDGRMEGAATLDRLALIPEAQAVRELRLGAGTLSLQRGDVGVVAVLLDGLRLELGNLAAQPADLSPTLTRTPGR
jgi:hypothetical protein